MEDVESIFAIYMVVEQNAWNCWQQIYIKFTNIKILGT
jgi:hypothetical protein